MNRGITEYEKFKVIRPIIGAHKMDSSGMPIIQKAINGRVDWEALIARGYKNISQRRDNAHTLALMFYHDKELIGLWNQPLKRIPLFQTCAAVTTPDFSLYSSMNPYEISHNVYQSRWLGCTWQNYGCTVIPTMGWADERTYDVCFSGVETGMPVAISTLGCHARKAAFLAGFNEMKRRISPSLIIVYGDMIPGMTGTFIRFRYKDAFAKEYTQLRMDCVSQVFSIEEVA